MTAGPEGAVCVAWGKALGQGSFAAKEDVGQRISEALYQYSGVIKKMLSSNVSPKAELKKRFRPLLILVKKREGDPQISQKPENEA